MSTENKLTCREFIEFLDDYIEEELPEQRHEIFERHLSVCVHCKDYLDSFRRTIALAGDVAKLEQVVDQAPTDLVKAIIKARASG